MVSGVCMMYVGLTCNVGHHGLCCMHDVRNNTAMRLCHPALPPHHLKVKKN